MEQFLFLLYAVFACGGALAVVFSQNIVRMAFYLVVCLSSTAALFFLLGADFLGATQLLVYVGGTVVILIFGLMLTASSPLAAIKSSSAEILQGGIVGLAFLAVVVSTVLSVDWVKIQQTLAQADHQTVISAPDTGFNPAQDGNSVRSIGTAVLGVRFDRDLQIKSPPAQQEPLAAEAAATNQTKTTTLSAGYLLPFEIISVHLLVVLIGASYLARAKRATTATAQ